MKRIRLPEGPLIFSEVIFIDLKTKSRSLLGFKKKAINISA